MRATFRTASLIVRLLTGSLLLPVALTAGLLTFPSTCRCDADAPHAHALLGIGGHSHAPGAGRGRHHQTDSDERRASDPSAREALASGQDGQRVTVTAPGGPALVALPALHAAGQAPAELPRDTPAERVPPRLEGVTDAPESPPPQV